MIGRNKRGIRRASTRVRLAVAAAVLVGGGAAGVVALAANHNGAVAAQSAGFYQRQNLSETHAMSAAMGWWSKSPQTSLSLISRMTPMRTFNTQRFHTHTIALQRGTVVGETRHQFVIESTNHKFEVWTVNHGTSFMNVGGNSTGMNAMTGGTMQMPRHMGMNMGARTLANGDIVFIFGERVHGQLLAQLVLFVAPTTAMPTTSPSTMPSATTSPSMTATPSATATPSMTTAPTATATPTAGAPTPTSTAPTFSGHGS